jgi:hypothetical protein
MNERNGGSRASLGNVLRSDPIYAMGCLHFCFSAVGGRIGRAIDHCATVPDGALHRARIGNIAFGTSQRDVGAVRLPRARGKRPTDLPFRSENQQTSHCPRRSEFRSYDAMAV